jgi:bifunctional enzyme CysN/CysC
VSALNGDNVVTRSDKMPWYDGPSLLHHLENVHVASDRNLVDVRFPVQYVIRPQSSAYPDYRGYAGQVAGGVLKPGDEIVSLPSGFSSHIAEIHTADGPVEQAFAPMAVALLLEHDLDISRGDMICRPNNQPTIGQDVEATISWFDSRHSLRADGIYAIKHTSRWARAKVTDLRYRLDVNTLHRDETATTLAMNEIGRIALRTTLPLFFDEYHRNRATGSFILVDEATNATVAGGMISGASA